MRLIINVVTLLLASCFAGRAGDGPLIINEIHHSPDVKQERVEFVELYNRGTNTLNLTGWAFDGGVHFAFPAGTQVEPGAYLVVAGDPGAVAMKFGVTGVLGPWTGQLSGEGERVVLRNAVGEVADEVDYQLGFPWPTVGDAPGNSIELINPELDNSLGGNWRASAGGAGGGPTLLPLVPDHSPWRYLKGLAEASTPATAWRAPDFDDSTWGEGALPIGYDPSVDLGTRLDDMRGNYTQIFLRRRFTAAAAATVTSLRLEALYDDGFKLWLNGVPLLNQAMSPGEVAFDASATGVARENNNYDRFDVPVPAGALREGDNVLAVQLANINLDGSSDCFFDARVTGVIGPTGQGPSPGRRNVTFATNAPPAIRQVEHSPETPRTGEAVTISAHVTDPDGVASVVLEYQVVAPGNYIELTDPAYAAGWTAVTMTPGAAAADVYSATLPVALSQHRHLIRYRLRARDAQGAEVRVPYADDPVPNFAVFCYDGVPAWTGAVRPGAAGAPGLLFTVDAAEMNRLPVFQLLSRSNAVAEASGWAPGAPNNQYGGDDYLWQGALVYAGKVYDHIRYRMRGGVWRYSMGKNAWKFDFNRGHDLEMRDDHGQRYRATWDKLSFRPNIQQGDYNHRGEQGLFESCGYQLFRLAGVDADVTTHVQFRIIDEADEVKPGNQYGGDFWGLYLAVEEQDGRFLKERGLPDGNIYDMEGGSGALNYTSANGPLDRSDLDSFQGAYDGNNYKQLDEAWWRAHLNLASYYSYQAILQGIHHYDIADGKNYFYYHNDADGRWVVQPWDLDLTWADNMYRAGQQGGDEPFKLRVLSNFSASPGQPNLAREFRNRVRELRDLLFNPDQAGAVIDEQAWLIHGTNSLSITDADRAQWDYNPVMANSAITLPEKAGRGRFYLFPNESGVAHSFFGAVQLMKRYIAYRAANATFSLDTISREPNRPATPVLSYQGPTGFPVNRLAFRASSYSGASAFQSVKWRIAEITRTNDPSFHPGEAWHFEITPTWETDELTNEVSEIVFPGDALKVGRVYRARVRHTDAEGRASNWSPPVEFTPGEPDYGAALVANLQLTEIMYHPPADGFEFLELHNASPSETLSLEGAKFTAGIDFTFPPGSTLAPSAYALLVHTTNAAAFLEYHGLPPATPLFGPFDGSLDNGGETVTLKTAGGGAEIFSVLYDDAPPWPAEADGGGHSLVPQEGPADLNDPAHWRASTRPKGSPGGGDPPPEAFQINNYELKPNGLQVSFAVGSNVIWVLQVAPNLTQWTPVATNTGPASYTLPFTDAGSRQFVRGVRP